MAHRCWQGIKRFSAHIMRLSRESRAGFKACLKMSWENRKGPLTCGSLVLRKWDSSEGSLHRAMFSWFDLPISTERTSGCLPSLPRCGAEEVKLESYQQSNIKIESYPFPLPKWELHSFPEQHYLSQWVKGALPSYNFNNRTIPHLPFPEKLQDRATCLLLGCKKKKKLFRKLWVKKRPRYLNTFQNIKAYA